MTGKQVWVVIGLAGLALGLWLYIALSPGMWGLIIPALIGTALAIHRR